MKRKIGKTGGKNTVGDEFSKRCEGDRQMSVFVSEWAGLDRFEQ